jgi:hypothetical protein
MGKTTNRNGGLMSILSRMIEHQVSREILEGQMEILDKYILLESVVLSQDYGFEIWKTDSVPNTIKYYWEKDGSHSALFSKMSDCLKDIDTILRQQEVLQND